MYKIMPAHKTNYKNNNAATLTFQKAHAMSNGVAIIDAGIVALFKQEPKLQRYAHLFLEIPADRQATEPVLLQRLMTKISFEETDPKIRNRLLNKLSYLNAYWYRYKLYIAAKWKDGNSKLNIETTKLAANDLAVLLIEGGFGTSRKHLFACSQEALHLLQKPEIYVEHAHSSKKFFHRLMPVNQITDLQFVHLKHEYTYLSNLSESDKRKLLSRSPACFKKGYGLANLWQETYGEINDQGEEVIYNQGFHHASFYARDIKDPEERAAAILENIIQWLALAAGQYIDTHPNLEPKGGIYQIPVATCSLLSALQPVFNAFDSNKQLTQIREIEEVIKQINDGFPMKLRVKCGGKTQWINCKFKINFQVFGTNLARALVAREIHDLNDKNFMAGNENIASGTSPSDFTQFCARVNHALGIQESEIKVYLATSPQQFKLILKGLKYNPEEELKYLYLTIRWLYQNYTASAEQNYHFQTLFACINDKLKIPYSLWCNESRDRTTRTKIKHMAYMQHKAIYGYFPCLLSKYDMKRLKELEANIPPNTGYPKLAANNTPGVVGPRIYKQNKPLYKLILNMFTRYKSNLDDGNEHLDELDDSMQSSKDLSKNWRAEPATLKNFFRHPLTFWKSVWYRVTGNSTPYLASVKWSPEMLNTKQLLSSVRYEIDVSQAPRELKEILGCQEDSKASLSLETAQRLRSLQLISGIKDSRLIITHQNTKSLQEKCHEKQSLLMIYTKLRQLERGESNLSLNNSEIQMIQKLQTNNKFYQSLFDVFILDQRSDCKAILGYLAKYNVEGYQAQIAGEDGMDEIPTCSAASTPVEAAPVAGISYALT